MTDLSGFGYQDAVMQMKPRMPDNEEYMRGYEQAKSSFALGGWRGLGGVYIAPHIAAPEPTEEDEC